MMDVSDTTLDQMVFEYLTSKNYQTTLGSFCSESPSIAALCRRVELNVRRPSKVQYADIVRRKIRKYLLSYFVETDTFLALMAPIRKIENALDDLKSVLKSTDSGYDCRALNYLKSGVIGNRKSDVLDKDTNLTNVYPKVCTPTNSRQLNSTPTKGNSHPRSLSGFCKAPSSKNTIKVECLRPKNSTTLPPPSTTTADSFPVAVDQSPPQQLLSSSDARLWDKAVDQHIAHTFVPDSVARAINMSSMTSDCLLQTDIKKVINKIESDPAMMSAFESILVDYFNNVSSSSMDYDQNAANDVHNAENPTKPVIQRNSPETELLSEFMIIGDTSLSTTTDCNINDQNQDRIGLCQNSFATKPERQFSQKVETDGDSTIFNLMKNPIEDSLSNFRNQSKQNLPICDDKPQTSKCDLDQRKCENFCLRYEFFDDISCSTLYTPQKISSDNVDTNVDADLRSVKVDLRSPAAKKLLFDDSTSPHNSDFPIKISGTSENRRPSVVLTPERIEAVLKKLHRK
uniref:LisH domain-containing protein n=1 Tax=Romanomermis culicivorax TaxID=13658 RepID=A0A915HKA5_ROMCU